MPSSIELSYSSFVSNSGWIYSRDEQPEATLLRNFPEGEDVGNGADFALTAFFNGEDEVMLMLVGSPAILADSGTEYGTIQVTFDGELDVNFKLMMLPDRPGAIFFASSHIIALLSVSDTFTVHVPLASGATVPIVVEVEPLKWEYMVGPKFSSEDHDD